MKQRLTERIKHLAENAANRIKYDILGGGIKKPLLFLLFFLITAIIISIPSYISYNKVKNLVETELGNNAKNIAITAAALVEKDAADFRELASIENYAESEYDEEYYREMLSAFRKIKEETKVSFVFAEKKISDSEIAYLFDGEDPNSEFFSKIGDIDGLQLVESTVYETGNTAVTDLVRDPVWGTYITGFSAINDPETGEVLGLVGVDYSIDYVAGIYKSVHGVFLLGVLVIVLLTSILLWRFLHISFDTQETDFITGLRNRHFHEVQMRRLIRKARISGDPFSLIMMDLDDFKKVNDRHGHVTGDAVLKAIARVIKNQTRDTDVCSRYGGDEFVILLPDTQAMQAVHIAERIREVISNIALLDEAKNNMFSTVSVGIAEWDKGMTGEMLTDNADKAMYYSKENGRNKVTVYGDI